MTDFRIGHGYDVHALADGLPLVLGGIEIPHTKGFVAHSDGDVAIHAVCDALLGAAALGDIGLHFPDTSDDFAGIDSKILLRRVAALLRERGYCHSMFREAVLLARLVEAEIVSPYSGILINTGVGNPTAPLITALGR